MVTKATAGAAGAQGTCRAPRPKVTSSSAFHRRPHGGSGPAACLAGMPASVTVPTGRQRSALQRLPLGQGWAVAPTARGRHVPTKIRAQDPEASAFGSPSLAASQGSRRVPATGPAGRGLQPGQADPPRGPSGAAWDPCDTPARQPPSAPRGRAVCLAATEDRLVPSAPQRTWVEPRTPPGPAPLLARVPPTSSARQGTAPARGHRLGGVLGGSRGPPRRPVSSGGPEVPTGRAAPARADTLPGPAGLGVYLPRTVPTADTPPPPSVRCDGRCDRPL